ncbi:HEPN domain-containing protein, partial [Clostridium grantii]
WWLPENIENNISGILKFNINDGANLELIGELVEDDELEVNIILGKTADGKDITLYKCFETNRVFNSNGFITTVIFANIIFEGVHFNNDADIKFNEISYHYSNLDEWAWMNGINISSSSNDEIDIKYKLPSKVTTDISEEYSIEIYPVTQTPNRCIVQKEANIKQKIYVKMINKKLNSFKEHTEQLQHIQNFISLGVGEPVTIIDVIGKTEVNKQEFDGKFLYPDVTVYFCIKNSLMDPKSILPPNMLFNLQNIKDEFNEIIKKWFDRSDVLKPVINLYFGTLYNSDMYLEQKFSSLIQALESYHRRTKINTEIDPDEHEKRINSIINSVDSQYEDWLKGRLSYSNEPTLRKRLNDMINECGTLLNLSSSKKKKSFISRICDTRNYFTHYDISLVDRVAKGRELLRICHKLKILIEFNLLLEISFKKETIIKLLAEKYKHHNIFD